jgi:hypothetical protein
VLTYHRGDERPAWVPTVTLNGGTDDLSTGYTFAVKVYDGSGTAALTKTTNITGAPAGVVTVAWAEGELDITPGPYRVILVATRTADSLEWTIEDQLQVKAS